MIYPRNGLLWNWFAHILKDLSSIDFVIYSFSWQSSFLPFQALKEIRVSWAQSCCLVLLRKLSMLFTFFLFILHFYLLWRLMNLYLTMRDAEICMCVGREFNLMYESEKSFKIVFISLHFCLSEKLKARINCCRVNQIFVVRKCIFKNQVLDIVENPK